MTNTTYTCDRCKQPAQDGRIRLMLTVGVMGCLPVYIGTGKGALDLCGGCADEMAKWLTSSGQQQT